MKTLLFSLLSCLVVSLNAQTVAPAAIDASKHPNLQAALDAVPESGGVVTIPPGNYEIMEPLRVKTAETRIVGGGAATHIINKSESGTPAFILRPVNLDTDKKSRLWRVQMADLRISGNEKSGDGVFAEGIQEIYLEGVSIDHNGGHGIQLKDCYEDPRIADCILTYNKKCGIEIIGCHDIVVNANHFEENQDALRCVDSFNLCMNGNNIDDHLGNGVIIENTYGSVLSGNMIEECNGTAIILDRDCYGITLSANVIAHHLKGGIDLRDACGCTISANTFTIAHEFSVRVGGGSERNTISANTFCNTYIGAGQDKRPAEDKTPMGIDEGTGVLVEKGVNGLILNGNTFSGLSTAAVWSTGEVKNVLVTSNLCMDCGRKLAKNSAWLSFEQKTGVLLKDNLNETSSTDP
ncbi:right-handed parallel beta-helix repeat-containing protein [Prosthecobacter sp.]|uniref:right-handed parallel beta-helix repeat-containing protein n=1 Tax=Prosthecobacter sp. TaxID=1965333 RepID=UPI002AB90911|nr:right-handed parallel beta-helix repeat-containing protein [Prosthecobacter sp.]MDZ4405779.1 right-handed parallel beta-helix repeat-containing protein [Prosthecobacter sp.]